MAFPVTSPRGEDHAGLYDLCYQRMVSSHLPARGGSRGITDTRGFSRSFQSPPREGRIGCR